MILTVLFVHMMIIAMPQSYSRIIFDNKECSEWNCSGETRVEKLLLSFCNVYGRSPCSKKELLLFHKGFCNHYGGDFFPSEEYYSNRELSKVLRSKKNTLCVSGDTCSFHVAKSGWTFQVLCQVLDTTLFNYSMFREVTRYPMAFDKNGRFIWSFNRMNAFWRQCLKDKFRYYIAVESYIKKGVGCYDIDKDAGLLKLPLLVLISYSRDVGMTVNLSGINEMHLYYGENATMDNIKSSSLPLLSDNIVLDSTSFSELEIYLKQILKENPSIEMIKTWEMVLFNKTLESGF